MIFNFLCLFTGKLLLKLTIEIKSSSWYGWIKFISFVRKHGINLIFNLKVTLKFQYVDYGRCAHVIYMIVLFRG